MSKKSGRVGKQFFYTVISPKESDYERCLEPSLKLAMRFDKYIVIKENGKNGNHAHLNIIGYFDKPCVQKDIKKRFLCVLKGYDWFSGSIRRGKPFYANRVIRTTDDFYRAINYNTKEEGFEVLLHKWDRTLDELKADAKPQLEEWNKKKAQNPKTPKIVSKNVLVPILRDYAGKNGLDITDKNDFLTSLVALRDEYETFYLKPHEVRALFAHCGTDAQLKSYFEDMLRWKDGSPM